MGNVIQLFWEQENLFDMIAELDGELTPELEMKLNNIAAEIPKKVDNIGFFIVTREKEIEALKIMEKSIYAKRKSIEKAIERFKSWLAFPAREFGVDGKIKGNVVTIKDISREVFDYIPDSIPFDCQQMVVTLKIPYDVYQTLVDDKVFQKYATKAVMEVDESLITAETNGVQIKTKRNVSFLGLKKLEVKQTEE